jgi:tetratricopeptide (TPR) repeat protein
MRNGLLVRFQRVAWLIGSLAYVLVSGSISLATSLSPESNTIVALLNEVVAVSQASRFFSEKARLMEEVMATQSQMGDAQAADSTYDRLSKIVDEEVKEAGGRRTEWRLRAKVDPLVRLARIYGRKGQKDAVERILSRINQLIGSSKSETERVMALRETLPLYVEMGDQDRSYRCADEMIASILRSPSEVDKEYLVQDVLQYLIHLQVSAGNTQAARDSLLKALRRVEGADHDNVRMQILPKLAVLQVTLGDKTNGQKTFERGMLLREHLLASQPEDEEKSRTARHFAFYKVRELSALAIGYGQAHDMIRGRKHLNDALDALEAVHADDQGLGWGQVLRAAASLGDDETVYRGIRFAQEGGFSDELLRELVHILVSKRKLDLAEQIGRRPSGQAFFAEALADAGEYAKASSYVEGLDLEHQPADTIRSLSRARARVKGTMSTVEWSKTWKVPGIRSYIMLGVIDELLSRSTDHERDP